MAGGLEPDDLQGPFQSEPFYDSMLLYPYDQVISQLCELVG